MPRHAPITKSVPTLLHVRMQAMDLSEEEYATFAQGIADLAAERERNPSDFEQFQVWLSWIR